ncbi:flavoprotein [Adhaeretor mobilis]|uniref:Phosphopantothenoylcysteine decarboxylase n=1 Tax=Adhaeretor mobilis TaxID=1930276 RepID=A0A517MVJ0_9BACT|nr:flavoprotein [Adhaeretor mobilis]QDS98900.1 Phosphopantothenoylcysteine decarboxylase [Adhaeretor mobilis]
MKAEMVVGVSGGIAAYKSAALVSQLVQEDIGVTVVMTKAAKHFVGEATFAALSGRPVASDSFEPSAYPLGAHIELARKADLLCVAPATANYLAQAASGLADDLLSTLTLCFTGPVLVAPAMNNEMWTKPSVQRNVEQLLADGVHTIGPGEGWLSCRVQGAGRMAEPAEIAQEIHRLLDAIDD